MRSSFKKYTAVFFVVFLISASAGAQSLLWRITGNGLKDTSYLFGTMHVRDQRVFQLHDSVMHAFHSVQAFAGEVLIDKQELAGMSKLILFPPGVELKDFITKSEYKKLKKYARKRIGMNALLINKIKPIYTSAMLSESSMKKEMSEPLDMYLQKLAKKHNKFLYGIETAAEQLSALDKIPLQEQVDMLMEQVNSGDAEVDIMEGMVEFYLAGNLDTLLSATQDESISDTFSIELIIKRNYLMADRIHAFIVQKSFFSAIGAAHLPGKEGVIALLRRKGYQVEPIMYQFQ